MAAYEGLFNALGLRDWCDEDKSGGLMSMSQLLAQAGGGDDSAGLPFPSLDVLHEACNKIGQTRDVTAGLENGFLAIRPELKLVLDPLTQPLSWMLDGALYLFETTPWWLMIPVLLLITWVASRSTGVTAFVLGVLVFFGLIDHYDVAMQTLSIVFVCTGLSVAMGVPIGIGMSKSDTAQRMIVPILDLACKRCPPSFT